MVTRGRKFPIGKAAGRNVSEPGCSLVTQYEDADPVVKWGRPLPRAQITEAARVIFRGRRVGMLWKISSPVLETRYGDVEEHQLARIRKRSRGGP